MAVAAAANALVTAAKVKYVWGRPQTSIADDDRIQSLVNLVSGNVAEWCGRDFIAATYTAELYDGPGGHKLFLDHFPVSLLTSITANGSAVSITDLNAYDADVKIDYASGIIHRASGWPVGIGNISVTYKSVYSASVPPAIEDVCIEAVIIMLEGRMKDSDTEQKEMPGGWMSKSFRERLSQFKRISLR